LVELGEERSDRLSFTIVDRTSVGHISAHRGGEFLHPTTLGGRDAKRTVPQTG
jgi:hypothetical protein